MTIFKILFWLGQILEIIIRMPYQQGRVRSERTRQGSTRQELTLLSLLLVGSFVLPFLYSATPWLSFADYHLPPWLGWMGAVFLAASLFVFWRAHRDLKTNWSPTLELYRDHTLITEGIYGVVRHPMYLSQWLMVIAQMLLLQNWIAGLSGLLVFIPFYFLRVKAEEQMMENKFGEQYRGYKQRTGAVLPKF
jgi:protein-S-isoprenylcysteine O-methyltransferase Ste14